MRTNKQARTLGSRLQGSGRKERGAGAGAPGGAHKRYLTVRLSLPVLAQSSSAVLWVPPPRARQVRHIASRHGVEGAQMRNNKQARTLGSRLQGAGRKERGAGAGRRVLGGAHKRYLTAGLLPAVLALVLRCFCLLLVLCRCHPLEAGFWPLWMIPLPRTNITEY